MQCPSTRSLRQRVRIKEKPEETFVSSGFLHTMGQHRIKISSASRCERSIRRLSVKSIRQAIQIDTSGAIQCRGHLRTQSIAMRAAYLAFDVQQLLRVHRELGQAQT